MIRKFKIDYFEPGSRVSAFAVVWSTIRAFLCRYRNPIYLLAGLPIRNANAISFEYNEEKERKRKRARGFVDLAEDVPLLSDNQYSISVVCLMASTCRSTTLLFFNYSEYFWFAFSSSLFSFPERAKKTCIPWHLKLSFAFSYRCIF